MIKFTLVAEDGARILGIGLSRENCARLLSDQPITYALEEHGIPELRGFRVVIVGGETEQSIRDQIEDAIETKQARESLDEAAAKIDAKEPSFTCPKCERTSYHPKDLEQRYCGACHEFFPEKGA